MIRLPAVAADNLPAAAPGPEAHPLGAGRGGR